MGCSQLTFSPKLITNLFYKFKLVFILFRGIKYVVSKDRKIRFESLAKTLENDDYDLVGLQEVHSTILIFGC
jgi:hypothetical protein